MEKFIPQGRHFETPKFACFRVQKCPKHAQNYYIRGISLCLLCEMRGSFPVSQRDTKEKERIKEIQDLIAKHRDKKCKAKAVFKPNTMDLLEYTAEQRVPQKGLC